MNNTPIIQHPSDELSSIESSLESSNQIAAVNSQIRNSAQTILRLRIDEFKSKLVQMFTSTAQFEKYKMIREVIVAEINNCAVTSEKEEIFIKELINNLQNCKVSSSEMTLSIIKNILALEDHEIVKSRLEEKELSIQVKLLNQEHCVDLYAFLNKFNLQFVKLDVQTPNSANQIFLQCLGRIQEKIKDKQIKNLEELNNQSQAKISNLEKQLEDMAKKVETIFSTLRNGVETFGSVGISSGLIKDEQLTSSGYWSNDDRWAPKHARLNTNTGCGGWAAASNDMKTYQYVQVDLGTSTKVSGVVVQGRASNNEYTTKFKVQFSDSINLLHYVKDKAGNDAVFNGNNDSQTAVRKIFEEAIKGRFFRIVPVGYHGHPYLRFDLLSF